MSSKSSSRSFLWIILSLPVLIVTWRITSSLEAPPAPVAPVRRLIEAAPMCPWRKPADDMRTYFPGATNYRTEPLILTGHLRELKKRLGRWPTPDENPLYLHHVYRGKEEIGGVLTRRVKGEYGAIEIVLAIAKNGAVAGVKIQRLREPEDTAKALDAAWLRSFQGKTGRNAWQLGQDIPAVPATAESSAQAVVEGVRSLLILHNVGLDISGAPHHL